MNKTLPRKKAYGLKENKGELQKVRTRGAPFDKTIAASAARGPRPNTWYKLSRQAENARYDSK